MGITLNLTADEIKDAQGTSFKPIPEGIYSATIYDAKLAKSKSGNMMYVIDFKITAGPEVRKNYKQRGWFVLKANALFSLIALNKAVGFPYPTKDTPAGEFEFPDADEYIGLEVNLKIVQEPYESVDDDDNDVTLFRNNIKTVLPYDESKVDGEAEESADSGLFLSK